MLVKPPSFECMEVKNLRRDERLLNRINFLMTINPKINPELRSRELFPKLEKV